MNMTIEANLDPLLTKLRFNISEVDLECLRTTASITSVHTDQFLEDFRIWLKDQPEYDYYFADDKKRTAYLAHEMEFWRISFLGRIDDGYFRNRLAFAREHSALGLPMSFIGVAMNYAATWWLTSIAKASEHNSVDHFAHALFRLTLVDFAVVTEALLTLAREKNNECTKLTDTIVDKTRRVAQTFAKGDFSLSYQPTNAHDESIAVVINRLRERLKNTVRQVKAIAQGNYSDDVRPASERDELGLALSDMMTSLRQISEKSVHDAWIKSGHTGLANLMRGDLTVSALADNVVSYLAKYTSALVGMLYCVDRELRTMLRRSGTYAHGASAEGREIRFGYGLVGQCAVEKEEIVLTDIPKNYVNISSSLGSALPACIVVFPLLFEGEVFGVIELGYADNIGDRVIQLLRHVSESIAIAIKSAHDGERIKYLLEDSRQQARELEAKKLELEAINAELARRQTSAPNTNALPREM